MEGNTKQDYTIITEKLHSEAKRLLADPEIKQIIGWKNGSYGLITSPAFISDDTEICELVWSPFCINSLACYPTLEEKLPLPRGTEEDKRKIVVLVKGCDSRGLVQMFAEKGYPRERLLVIGIPCTGQIDPERLGQKLKEKNIEKDITHNDIDVTDVGKGFKITLDEISIDMPKLELIYDKCSTCQYPNPLIHDMLLAEPVQARGQANDGYERVTELDGLTSAEKWNYWSEKFQRCIRCYACRNICPVCYCNECLTDKWVPDWINKSTNLTENTMFHIMRALHLSGRCISCHECERACPVGIPLLDLYKILEKELIDQYDFKPGIDPEASPILSTFNPEDPGEFIL